MQNHIRNFAIIAHIDHGKSTLADRLLEMTGTVAMRDMHAQMLDSNPIERERGITIKLAPVRMEYQSSVISHQSSVKSEDGKHAALAGGLKTEDYILNLIDTPGHVDFGYEVSRSLAACEGAILVVDATQGVQAQTLANLHQARAHNLVIIPVINKIDLPNAKIEETRKEIQDLGFKNQEIIEISAKTGQHVNQVLKAVVERIPPPRGEPDKPLRALVFSSQYDAHKGVVVFVRVVDGTIVKDSGNLVPDSRNQAVKPYQKLRFMASGAGVTPIEVGYFMPQMTPLRQGFGGLAAGEVGYIATGLKDIRFAKVGDTITVGKSGQLTVDSSRKKTVHFPLSTVHSLPGYKEPKPMVFLGLFPISADEITQAREAMDRLRLSDSAFTFRPISSLALGNGFHCGFLGLLHAEIVQERLLREFGLTMIATIPSVEYHISTLDSGNQAIKVIQSASEFPDPSTVKEVKEPVMQVTIFSPKQYIGAIMQLAQEKRGAYIDLKYISEQAEFTYLIPLSEMIVDFFDRLKSVTEGYASLDYEFFDYQAVDVEKVDILVNHEKVDALSFLVVKNQAQFRARVIVEKLSEVIPRAQFTIPIQAAIGGQIISRADVKAFRKDVIQKLYGGDRTRKDKLLKKQKKGKSRMKLVGRVEIPQGAFFEVLKRSN